MLYFLSKKNVCSFRLRFFKTGQKLYWRASFTSDQLLNTLKINSMWSMKGSSKGRSWGQLPPLPHIFWQIRKPHLNWEADYAHHITTTPPD